MRTTRTKTGPGTKARTRTRTRTKLNGNSVENPGKTASDIALELRKILSKQGVPAAARVNAARTLAELEGLLGRHQREPAKGATAALSSLSRDDLIGELDRLRTLFDLGLIL